MSIIHQYSCDLVTAYRRDTYVANSFRYSLDLEYWENTGKYHIPGMRFLVS